MNHNAEKRSPAELSELGHFALGDLLAEAAESGTLPEVQQLLAAGADPDHRHGPDELTPLMLAAQRNAINIVEALIGAGADVNEVVFADGFYAAVTFAAVNRHKALYNRLRPLTSVEVLEDTAYDDPYQKDKYDKRVTAIVKAARAGRLDRVTHLLSSGANVNGLGDDGVTPLVAAAGAGHLEIVELLLSSGARADLTERGTLALYGALNPAVIHCLVAAGADPNGVPALGSTPLTIAATAGRVPEVQALLETGAQVDLANLEGRTPLALAAEKGHVDMIHVLIAAEADVNARTPNGRTPLLLALKNPDAVQALLDAGADVNARADDGQTALMRAPNAEVTRLLLVGGADPNLFDSAGRTALHLTRSPETAAALVEAGASLDAADAQGQTALMYAAKRGHAEMAEWLLNAGADPTRKDASGQKAIELARNGFIFGSERILPFFEAADQTIREHHPE